jgi:Mrp family chromosome partitioning ATPase
VNAVLFVTRPGRTKADTAAAALEIFRRSGARVIGTVLNCIPRSRNDYYGAHQYSSPYSNKGYYSSKANEGGKAPAPEVKPLAAEMLPAASLLGRVAKLSNVMPVDELPSPDPSRNSPA